MTRPILYFTVTFSIVFGCLYWLLNGSGPVPLFNRAILGFTEVQTSAAAAGLKLIGEPVRASANTLNGPSFSCVVDFGCNGMSAVVLLAAGILAFPAVGWRKRLLGFFTLLPIVVALNVLRIVGLYWTGANIPTWFGPSHVYVWQTLVICVTAALWLTWLSWNTHGHDRSS